MMKILRARLTPEGQRHLLVLTLAFSGGLGLVAWLWPFDHEALEALRKEVDRLQMELPARSHKGPQKPHAADSGSQDMALPDEPALAEADGVWPWLQARMQSQGLQVQSLRPQAVTTTDGLPQQAVSLQLQGRWHDWRALEAALNAHAPWWVIDQWQVAPVAAASETVRIELQARLGLRPAALPPSQTPRIWPGWPVVAAPPTLAAGALSASAQHAAAAAPDREAADLVSADPRSWPIDRLRLHGVWWQAGVPYAVLGVGQDRVALGVGQRIGREGYRVHRIGDDHAELLATNPLGTALRLTLQEGKP